MDVKQECKFVATTVGKSENTLVSAGQMFAAIVEYVQSPGTDGAQQVIDAGFEPNKSGIASMCRSMPEWPKGVGSSDRNMRRILSYAKDPKKQEENAERKREERAVTKSAPAGSANVTEPPDLTEYVRPPTVPHPNFEAAKKAVLDLEGEERKLFHDWYREHLSQVYGESRVVKKKQEKGIYAGIRDPDPEWIRMGASFTSPASAQPGTPEYEAEVAAFYTARTDFLAENAARLRAKDRKAVDW